MELGTVSRALAILESLSKVRDANLETIAQQAGLPKTTTLRLLTTLTENKYVVKDSNDRYYLSMKMFAVGSRALSHIDLIDISRPIARELSKATGETVHMGILEEKRALYVLKNESHYNIRMYSRIGRSCPLHSSAMGKCLMIDKDSSFIDDYAASGELVSYTPKTISTKEALAKELEKVRQQGYAVDDEENESQIVCVAAPIIDYEGKVVAAMSVSTPTFRLDDAKLKKNIGLVVEYCQKISTILGKLGH